MVVRATQVAQVVLMSRLWLVAALLSLSAFVGLLTMSTVGAQEPVREYRFQGRAIIDGSPAAKGTSVEIRVGDTVIARSQVNDQQGNWSLTANAQLLEKGVCDATFYVGGRRADRQWNRCTVNIELEVNKANPPVVPPETTPPDEGGDPPTDPPDGDDPPTDPPTEDDPPTDEDDPPTGDPPGGDPPGDDPPGDDPPGDDPPGDDPPGDDPPGDDPPGDDPPGDDPPGDDPPGDDPPDKDPPDDDPPKGDTPDDPPGDKPTEESESDDSEDEPADEDDSDEGDDSKDEDSKDDDAASTASGGESSGVTVRPQSPPGTGTGGLWSQDDGMSAWLVVAGVAGVVTIAALLASAGLVVGRRRAG